MTYDPDAERQMNDWLEAVIKALKAELARRNKQ